MQQKAKNAAINLSAWYLAEKELKKSGVKQLEFNVNTKYRKERERMGERDPCKGQNKLMIYSML